MREEATALFQKALSLPLEERAELAGSLIDSLDPVVSEDVEAAWQVEIARRLESVRAGAATMVPWQEVQENARAILREEAS